MTLGVKSNLLGGRDFIPTVEELFVQGHLAQINYLIVAHWICVCMSGVEERESLHAVCVYVYAAFQPSLRM